MYGYSLIQWLFFFYFYCFFGWCFESTYVSIKQRKFVNRGFMRGPFLPIYGSGGIMMLVVSMPFRDNVLLTYFAGCVGATILEYITGVTMEKLFKVRYWDYSNQKFNFRGHICLSSTIAWGFLTILMTKVVHPFFSSFVLSIPTMLLNVITVVLTMGIAADFAMAFRTALDIRDILMKMEETKDEMRLIRKRLDVYIALTNADMEQRKEELARLLEKGFDTVESKAQAIKDGVSENFADVREGISDVKESIGEVKASIEANLEKLKDYDWPLEKYFAGAREDWLELKIKYATALEKYKEGLMGVKDFLRRDMIRSNPTMTSKKFAESLQELKDRANNWKKKD
ncbi:MAG: hypothetical protein J6033_02875 [Lachnospiraceae bacterium]|nr:hypothetical protein [Lachnospiraceae bacterium]